MLASRYPSKSLTADSSQYYAMALKFGGTSTGMMSKEFRQIFANLFWEWDDLPVQ